MQVRCQMSLQTKFLASPISISMSKASVLRLGFVPVHCTNFKIAHGLVKTLTTKASMRGFEALQAPIRAIERFAHVERESWQVNPIADAKVSCLEPVRPPPEVENPLPEDLALRVEINTEVSVSNVQGICCIVCVTSP